MTQQGLGKGLDFESLRRAIERGDAKALADLYADEAEVTIVNCNSPPSSPFVLRGGGGAIAEHLRAACANGAEHGVENEVVGQGPECHVPPPTLRNPIFETVRAVRCCCAERPPILKQNLNNSLLASRSKANRAQRR